MTWLGVNGFLPMNRILQPSLSSRVPIFLDLRVISFCCSNVIMNVSSGLAESCFPISPSQNRERERHRQQTGARCFKVSLVSLCVFQLEAQFQNLQCKQACPNWTEYQCPPLRGVMASSPRSEGDSSLFVMPVTGTDVGTGIDLQVYFLRLKTTHQLLLYMLMPRSFWT